ncbi:MAG: YciI family protein [Woeseiaceae bacterium]|jgi:uncharacterized protein YciI
MFYFVHCRDAPGNAGLRLSVRDRHLDYMARHEHRIVLGGPTAAGDTGGADGTLLIVDFPDVTSVHNFLDEDPYHHAGLFERRIVKGWRPVRFAPELLAGFFPEPTGGGQS